MSLNSVQLQGNLVREPELRYSTNGMAVCTFTVAHSERRKDSEHTAFIGCTAFGKTAETLSQYRHKGDEVLVEGRVTQDSWEDKNGGGKKSKTYIAVIRFHFTNGTKREGQMPAAQPAARPAPQAPANTPPEEDDVPF